MAYQSVLTEWHNKIVIPGFSSLCRRVVNTDSIEKDNGGVHSKGAVNASGSACLRTDSLTSAAFPSLENQVAVYRGSGE